MMNAVQRNVLRLRTILRARHYKAVFLTDEGPLRRSAERVLADLRDFCFAERSTYDADGRMAARREGRREVWLRITKHLNLDEATVQQLMEAEDGL
jgi:hypothetical protein